MSLRLRLRALFRRRQLERDLEDELAFHLAMKAGKLGNEEAARRQFGNVTWFRETCRELWSLGPLEVFWQDVRYGARMLRRSPAFTTVAVLSLALGIGANTAIFSLVNAVMLKSLPVPNPHELRVMRWVGPGSNISMSGQTDRTPSGMITSGSLSYPVYRAFRDSNAGFSSVFAFARLPEVSVVHRRQAFTSFGFLVSGNFFQGLGVKPLLGRAIGPEDDRTGAPPVVVISHAWWEGHALLDPGILGETVMLNGAGYTVVGVLPRDFNGPLGGSDAGIYVPMAAQPLIQPNFLSLTSPGIWWVEIMARLAPGADERRAHAEFEVLFNRNITIEPGKRPALVIEDGRSGPWISRSYYAKQLVPLMVVAGLVLLIACANLAGMLLARGAARQHEMALRAAIGAGRLRLVRQLLTESLLVSFAGTGLGLVLAWWGKQTLPKLLWPFDEPPRFDTHTDLRVLAFTLGLSLGTALLFGLAPAFRAARIHPAIGLRNNASRLAPRLRVGKALLAAQVGLSLLLLVGAGLLLRTLVNLWNVDPGFRTENLLLFRLDASTAGYEGGRLADFYDRARESVEAIPGVHAVTFSNLALLSGWMSNTSVTIPGRKKPGMAYHLEVGDSFMSTMGIPLLFGRDFSSKDNQATPKVVIVNEAFARSLFEGENPVGKTITVNKTDFQIVGVCRNASYDRLTSAVPPTAYFPFRQAELRAVFFEVRTGVSPLSVAPAIRRAVAALDTNVPLTQMKTQTMQIEQLIASQRLFAALCGFFAALALLLSAIGLFGAMAYTVARRTGEIGVRMALGAPRGKVLWMVLRESLLLTALGAALGVPAALAATRLIENRLFGVKPNDPATIAVAAAALLAVGLIAAWIPARRAASIDPVTALRSE
jgi:predicted permease